MARQPKPIGHYSEMVAAAAPLVRVLRHGEEVRLAVPSTPYTRRETYRRIAGLAHRAFGSGTYSVRLSGDTVTVRRLSEEDIHLKKLGRTWVYRGSTYAARLPLLEPRHTKRDNAA